MGIDRLNHSTWECSYVRKQGEEDEWLDKLSLFDRAK